MPANVSFALLPTLLAGLSTGIGSATVFFIRRPKPQHMALILGLSAGVMIYVSFAELLHIALDKVGLLTANLGFFIGIVFIAVVDVLVPHEYEEERVGDRPVSSGIGKSSLLMRTGILTALGIAIHNFPEGLAVFSSAITGDLPLGLVVALAMAIHNIPEGISVAMPIVEATGSRRRAFLYSLSAGLAEPVGAIIGYAILSPFLTPTLLYTLLAFSAGIMVYISLDELLPMAHKYGEEHLVIAGVGAGMLIMAVSIYFIT